MSRPESPLTPERPPDQGAPAPGGGVRRGWRRLRLIHLAGLVLLLCLGLLILHPGQVDVQTASAAPASGLQLRADTSSVTAWPALRMLEDTHGTLDAATVHQHLDQFRPPDSRYQNLGQRRSTIWLHTVLELDDQAPPPWVARIGYPLLNSVDLHLFDAGGRQIHHTHTGSLVPHRERGLDTRALAMELHLQPGQRYDLLLRVQSASALIVPLELLQWPAASALESRELAFQGLVCGLTLFMLAYSLSRWVTLRQPMFLAYAALLLSTLLFWLTFFGTGTQYLWPDNAWLATNLTAAASLPAAAANIMFSMYALDVPRSWPRLARAMYGLVVLVLLCLLLFVAGVIDYRACAAIGSVAATSHFALLIPTALIRWREGDRAAAFLLLGWLLFATGLIQLTTLLRGLWPANAWTIHGAQLGAIGEMLCFLMVLGLRVEHLREAAERSRREHDLLHALAHTDALTGLSNRRGLELALAACRSETLAHDGRPAPYRALFALDLDGFKQINDQLGHEAGDEVLREVARRLRDVMRQSDVVARPGGDEFVVLAQSLKTPADAALIGQKLLEQFRAPHRLLGGRHERAVGVTIGYSLVQGAAPDPAEWSRRADAAMYAGKQAGKNCVVDHADILDRSGSPAAAGPIGSPTHSPA